PSDAIQIQCQTVQHSERGGGGVFNWRNSGHPGHPAPLMEPWLVLPVDDAATRHVAESPQSRSVAPSGSAGYHRAVMPKFAVILPAAGKSSRFSLQKRKKPFVDLKGRAVWLRAAEHFANRDDVVQTLVVLAPDDVEWFKEKFAPNLAFMNVELVTGGAERA